MKKKLALLLCMIVCILGMTGCGKTKTNEVLNEQNETEIQSYVDFALGFVADLVANDYDGVDWNEQQDAYFANGLINYSQAIRLPFTFSYKNQVTATASYRRAIEEVGTIRQYEDYRYTYKADEVIVTVTAVGEKRNADVEVILETQMPNKITISSIAYNVDYTFGEKMSKAGLNTLLGMGTVFIILILISLLISLFGFIPKIMNKSKKPAVEEAVVAAPAEVPVVEESELADDLELVAVIAAAIAASEGTSTDSFTVRSIRKNNARKWQNA